MALGPLGGLPGIVVSTYNLEFFFGMAAAYWLRRGPVPIPHALFLLGVVGFSATAGMEVLGIVDGYAAWARLPYGLASTMIILGLVEMERQGQLGIWTAVLWLGRSSYSIYLFHLTFIGITYKLWSAVGMAELAPVWVSYGVIVLAGIGGSAAISRLVEYPLMRWVRQRLERHFSRS
jgi:peptidoglycan/LPS O-acetylase OafA/YrhL